MLVLMVRILGYGSRQLEYNNVKDAMDAFHDNEVKGILHLPSNYTTSLGKFTTHGTKTNDSDAIIHGFADLWTDNTSMCFILKLLNN